MAGFLDAVVTTDRIFKGAARLVYAAEGQSFPGSIDSVMDTREYGLTHHWYDLGGTTPDGIRVVRGFDKDEGIEVDQIKSAIMKGAARNWRGQMATNLLETSLANLAIVWEGGTLRTVGDEKLLDFGSPEQVTERLLAAVQQHSESGKFRMIVIRKATPAGEDAEITLQSTDPAAIPFTVDMEADLTVAEVVNNMFRVIEQQ